jgi:selenocysteine lyase/cysteine desulfurase
MIMNCQKHLFSINEDVHYLNCAYKAPILKSAEKAAINALIKDRNPFNLKADDFFSDVNKVKIEFGKLINSSKENIALIPSTSYGFSSVLNNVKSSPGKTAITIKDEFPGSYFCLEKWTKKNNNNLKVISPSSTSHTVGENWNEQILDNINNNTSLVLMSSIHWMNGTKFKLKEIGERCKKFGAIFIVDGTQSVGALKMDINECNIDALVCASYKWLFGPYSMGLAYFSDQFANGSPLEESWMNRTNASNFSSLTDYDSNYQVKANRFDVGEKSNFLLMPILLEGLKQVNKWTVNGIQSYCNELTYPLLKNLSEIGIKFEEQKYFTPHLFSLNLPKKIDPIHLKANLEENNVFISLRGDFLRVSLNVFNNKNDIEKLIYVIKKTIA